MLRCKALSEKFRIVLLVGYWSEMISGGCAGGKRVGFLWEEGGAGGLDVEQDGWEVARVTLPLSCSRVAGGHGSHIVIGWVVNW